MRKLVILTVLVMVVSASCGSEDQPPTLSANTAPAACFTVVPTSGPADALFQVNASCSTDQQDAVTALQVRWNWESDEAWDTEFSTTKTASHAYASQGMKAITVEVRDSGGLTAQAIRSVTAGQAPPPDPGMVPIPVGSILMGSPLDEPGRNADEIQHQAALTKAFYMCNHEVTQAEWDSVMHWNESRFRGPDLPVETVTWFDAVAYCNQRSIGDSLNPVYTLSEIDTSGYHITSAMVSWDQNANGYRLPTEAEWEYACRAGSPTAFCNGATQDLSCGTNDSLRVVGWYCGNSSDKPHAVKGKQTNAWDLYDMHGNVWEWCWDWYERYGGDAADPTGPVSGSLRVIRGGGWFNYARDCRSARRSDAHPGDWGYYLGLRVTRTAE